MVKAKKADTSLPAVAKADAPPPAADHGGEPQTPPARLDSSIVIGRTEHETSTLTLKSEIPSTVGRTQWDAAVDILKLLGSGAPYLLIVGLALFGFFKFQELNQQRDADLQRAREAATENFQKQLGAANKALIDTYTAMGAISGTQIKNVNEMLDLHGKAIARTQELQQNHEQLKTRSEQATREAEAVSQNLKSVQAILARDQDELKKLEVALSDRRRQLADSAQQVSEVRDRLIALARATRDNDAGLRTLAENVLREYDIQVADLLTAKSGQATAGFGSLRDLIGRDESEMLDFLRSDQRFAFVVRPESSGSKARNYIAAERSPEGVFKNVTEIETDGKRVVSARNISALFGVRYPRDIDNWNSPPGGFIYVAYSTNNMWSFEAQTERSSWGVDDLKLAEVIKGRNETIAYIEPDQLEQLVPAEVFKTWFDGDTPFDHSLRYRMHKNSKDFDASKILPASLPGLPLPLRQSVIRLFNGAVQRRNLEVSVMTLAGASGEKVLGEIAAAVVRPDFEIISARPLEGGVGNKFTLVGRYDKAKFRPEKNATFLFSLLDGSWKLEQFISKESAAIATK